jgi:hypothetical protein
VLIFDGLAHVWFFQFFPGFVHTLQSILLLSLREFDLTSSTYTVRRSIYPVAESVYSTGWRCFLSYSVIFPCTFSSHRRFGVITIWSVSNEPYKILFTRPCNDSVRGLCVCIRRRVCAYL